MTYRDKLKAERPDRIQNTCIGGCYGCPGDYFPNSPSQAHNHCVVNRDNCARCWNTEIPGQLDANKIAARITELYTAFRDAEFDHQEAYEFAKIVITEEIKHDLSKM